ncbi:TPA: thiamine biosynthesis protein ThiS [Candidatus Delongbacteria bacterium]|nr:MAG: thiamine biosynthesis protein ThiS [Candidatus Delongbacteria bacterium GWF2_40_14]HAQ62593.1 thiamine biosynthesis protein ThiS [Candidatus Delongbacteria bacterium]
METVSVNGNIIEWTEGMTVRDVLNVMKYTFKLLIVDVNGEHVKRDQYDTYKVPKNSEVNVIHLMSGG